MFFKRKPQPTGPIDYLVVGLGNPGAKYEGTRHNAGFLAIDALADKLGVKKIDRLKFRSLCAEAKLGDKRLLLLKPSTFMNLSGEAVREAAQFYKLPPEHILVLFDDVSLDVGQLRIRRKGSDGGHNGIKSIILQLNSDEFPRVKIGVGKKPHPDYDLADWVLGKFSAADSKTLDTLFERAAQAAVCVIEEGIDRAMSQFNS